MPSAPPAVEVTDGTPPAESFSSLSLDPLPSSSKPFDSSNPSSPNPPQGPPSIPTAPALASPLMTSNGAFSPSSTSPSLSPLAQSRLQQQQRQPLPHSPSASTSASSPPYTYAQVNPEFIASSSIHHQSFRLPATCPSSSSSSSRSNSTNNTPTQSSATSDTKNASSSIDSATELQRQKQLQQQRLRNQTAPGPSSEHLPSSPSLSQQHPPRNASEPASRSYPNSPNLSNSNGNFSTPNSPARGGSKAYSAPRPLSSFNAPPSGMLSPRFPPSSSSSSYGLGLSSAGFSSVASPSSVCPGSFFGSYSGSSRSTKATTPGSRGESQPPRSSLVIHDLSSPTDKSYSQKRSAPTVTVSSTRTKHLPPPAAISSNPEQQPLSTATEEPESPIRAERKKPEAEEEKKDGETVVNPKEEVERRTNEALKEPAGEKEVGSGSGDNKPISNFPDLSKDRGFQDGEKTSLPNMDVNSDLDISIRKLVSKDVLKDLLEDPRGRYRFQEYLAKEGHPSSLAALAFYSDSQAYKKYLNELDAVAVAMHETYLGPSAPYAFADSTGVPDSYRIGMNVHSRIQSSPFDRASMHALQELYVREFGSFVKRKIAERARVKLGAFPSLDERGDLGDVFCLTNPRLPDHPIVMCSDGFLRLTEYPRERLVGRNCRFLQGPSTNPDAVKNLRISIQEQKPCCEIILNYTKSGRPFWNCLSMIPLKDSQGRLEYYIGGQVDISGALASNRTLSFLIGASENPQGEPTADQVPASESSPAAELRISEEVIKAVEQKTSARPIFPTRSTNLSQVSPQQSGSSAMVSSGSNSGLTGGSAFLNSGKKDGGGTLMSAKMINSGGAGNAGTTMKKDEEDGESGSQAVEAGESSNKAPLKTAINGAVGTFQWPREPDATAFTDVYSKLLLIDSSTFQVLHVSVPLLEQLGYPTQTAAHRFSSPLLHQRMTKLLIMPTKAETASVVKEVEEVFRQGFALSVQAGLKQCRNQGRKIGEHVRAEDGRRFSVGLLHMTPMKDAGGTIRTYAIVFGD